MVNIMKRQVNYLVTESDIRQMFGKSWPDRAIKDYASMKENINASADQTDANTQTIETLDARLDVLEPQVVSIDGRLVIVEGQVVAIDARLTTAEGQIVTLRTDLDTHIAAESAHGATGNIVGTDDYASATVGGTVLLAGAVANAVTSSVSVTSPDATAAPATYNQAQAQSVVTLANEMKGDINTLTANFNALVTKFNALLASERAAKQLAT